MVRVLYIVAFLLLLLSCDHTAIVVNPHSTPIIIIIIIIIIIAIQPFSGLSQGEVDTIYNELKKVYPYVQIKKAIALPGNAYHALRKRYRADTIVHYLNQGTEVGHVIIVLTHADISCTKGAINDYGVMGLGFCPGKACVASGFRLSKTNTLNQLFKVAIHELGHTQGLPHCPVQICFMRDAEGKNYTNELTEFCVDCKKQLVSKGWAL